MGNPMFLISNIFKMSYFCRWSILSILCWFLLASISDGDICWMDSQMLMSSLFVACSLITMKIKNSWFGGARFWTEETSSVFWHLLGVTSIPVTFLSCRLYIWNDNHKSPPSLQPTCSAKLFPWAVLFVFAKFSVPSRAPDIIPFFKIYIF